MSAFHDNALMGASGSQGYQISRSVRLRSSASAYFNRTNASSPTNAIKWTWSGWVKRGSLGAQQNLVGATNSGSDDTYFNFNSSDKIVLGSYTGAGTDYGITTAAVFRDPSAWYHVVAVLDTANATSADRAIIYVNGVRQTVTNSANGMWPQNATNNKINTASQVVNIGRRSLGDSYLDGYLTEVNFIDGQALTPSSFGENDTVTGVWKPKKYAGTYGTNGFYLNFSDNSGATATTIGKDYSGNGNNWTPNNISVTSGTTYDSMLDVPTLYADGGNGRGNYCTLNPLQPASTTVVVPTDGNLKMTGTASGNNVTGTMAIQASTYFEGTAITGGGTLQFGIRNLSTSNTYVYDSSGNKVLAGTSTAYGASFTTNDVIGVAVDPVNLTLQFFKNGTSQGTITSAFPSGDYVPFFYASNTNSSAANFGQRPFTYTPPSGFKALNTQNLPDSTIKKGNQYFDVSTWTGDGTSSRAITNSGSFQPDLVWTKARSGASNLSHNLVDSVRGAGLSLFSDQTTAETSLATGVTAFNSNGFQIGTWPNVSSSAEVGWQWKKGATQGFDIVTWAGNSTSGRTIAHSLGVAPNMIITKSRTNASSWVVGIGNISGFGVNDYLSLNSTNAKASSSTFYQAYGSSTFTVGVSAADEMNKTGNNYVSYLFSEVAGFSRMGSYQGNGSSDGSFVYLGFRPRWILFKDSTNAATNWVLQDTSRFTYNVTTGGLLANTSASEYSTGYDVDILSNGFKIRRSGGDTNASGATIVYAAFAENPFRYSLAR